MEVVGRVESLWRYPVKSMAGEKLDRAWLGFAGIYGDRVAAVSSDQSGCRISLADGPRAAPHAADAPPVPGP